MRPAVAICTCLGLLFVVGCEPPRYASPSYVNSAVRQSEQDLRGDLGLLESQVALLETQRELDEDKVGQMVMAEVERSTLALQRADAVRSEFDALWSRAASPSISDRRVAAVLLADVQPSYRHRAEVELERLVSDPDKTVQTAAAQSLNAMHNAGGMRPGTIVLVVFLHAVAILALAAMAFGLYRMLFNHQFAAQETATRAVALLVALFAYVTCRAYLVAIPTLLERALVQYDMYVSMASAVVGTGAAQLYISSMNTRRETAPRLLILVCGLVSAMFMDTYLTMAGTFAVQNTGLPNAMFVLGAGLYFISKAEAVPRRRPTVERGSSRRTRNRSRRADVAETTVGV